MKYQGVGELEKIGRAGSVSIDELIGFRKIKRCRILSSYWLCTNPGKDGVAEHLNNDGYWESWITQWVSENVSPGSVCIDGGATYGYYTYFLAQHGCRVYSIEANTELIPLLEYSNFLNGSIDRVTIINKAISNKSGEQVRLGFSDTIGGTSINANDDYGSIHVGTIALDELLAVEKKIDFVKLDISASELLAWEGMQTIMQVNPMCTCILEFAPAYYPDGGRNFINTLLTDHFVYHINSAGEEIPLHDFSIFEDPSINWLMLVIKSRSTTMPANNILSVLQAID